MLARSLLLCAALSLLAGPALADNYTLGDFIDDIVKPGERQGLTGRIDVAGGLNHTKAEHSSWMPSRFTSDDGGGGAVIGVGCGITNQLMLNVGFRGLLYGENAPLGIVMGPVAMIFADEHIATLVTLSYYFRDTHPSLFAEAGIGGGTMDNPFNDDAINMDNTDGPSFYGGIGYEFAKHFQAQVHFVFTENSDSERTRKGDWTASAVLLSLGIIGY